MTIAGKRYIACRNEEEAEKDRKDREAIVVALDRQLKKGDKALIDNSAYRRYGNATLRGTVLSEHPANSALGLLLDYLFPVSVRTSCFADDKGSICRFPLANKATAKQNLFWPWPVGED